MGEEDNIWFGSISSKPKRKATNNNANKRTKSKTKERSLNYIGGDAEEVRHKMWDTHPRIGFVSDSIAGRYNISKDLLRERLNREGFVDEIIKRNNADYKTKAVTKTWDNNVLGETTTPTSGTDFYGLDDVGTLINEGKVKPINETWNESKFTNNKGRKTNAARGETHYDNIGLMAATLKYFRELAKKDFPNASSYDLDRYASIYYNRGRKGGKDWINNGNEGYHFKRRSLENAGK